MRSVLFALPLTREASWSCRSAVVAAPAATFWALFAGRRADGGICLSGLRARTGERPRRGDLPLPCCHCSRKPANAEARSLSSFWRREALAPPWPLLPPLAQGPRLE
eukprot:14974177-Alexandrium_andersonii.AAC.1